MSDRLSPHERALLDAMQRDDTPDGAAQRHAKQRLFTQLGIAAAGTLATGATVSQAATTSTGAALSHVSGAAVGSVTTGASVGGSSAVAGAASASKVGVIAALATKVGATKVAVVFCATLASAGGAVLWSRTAVDGGERTMAPPSPALVNERAALSSALPSPAAPASPGAATPLAATMEAVAEPQTGSDETNVTARATNGPTSGAARRATGTRSSLEDEAQLLARAHGFIRSGSPESAIEVLLDHQKQFPGGTLSLERRATLAVARCQSGQLTRGRAEAERFRRKHPDSPMVKRLESACQLNER